MKGQVSRGAVGRGLSRRCWPVASCPVSGVLELVVAVDYALPLLCSCALYTQFRLAHILRSIIELVLLYRCTDVLMEANACGWIDVCVGA